MPPVYATVSFFSYRFFRSYTYYSFIEAGMSVFSNHARAITQKLNFTRSLRGKVHPKESRTRLTERQRIKAVTLSAFLYVLNEFKWTMAFDLSNFVFEKKKKTSTNWFCCLDCFGPFCKESFRAQRQEISPNTSSSLTIRSTYNSSFWVYLFLVLLLEIPSNKGEYPSISVQLRNPIFDLLFFQPYFMYTVKVQDFLSYIWYFQTYASENSGSCYNTSLFDPVRLIPYSTF